MAPAAGILRAGGLTAQLRKARRMPEIVISEFMDRAAVADLSARHDVLYEPSLVDDPDRLNGLLADAVALIVRNRTQVRGDLIAAGPGLRCIGRLGVGLDNIDVPACDSRGIAVFPATGANDLCVAEYVTTMILTLLRGAYGSTPAMLDGAWPRQSLIGREMAGRFLGLVGFGGIAREVADRAAALGMRILAHDPYVGPRDEAWSMAENVSLEELFSQSDAISLHVPLTPETRRMIDTRTLASMRKDAVLINAARGGVVDEKALATALRSGDLAGAALDVFEEEPLSAEAAAVFQGCPNLILTPHIAGVTEESNVRVSRMIADLVSGHLRCAA